MKIKSIHLNNFQAHSNLKLDLNDGVNVITGLSNSGKSCIRRALSWALFCDNISENDLRKEGTKKTSVTVTFDNNVKVERIRSTSINRYVLTVNNKTQQFDSFGRDVPEEIKNAINLDYIQIDGEKLNLNISEQITLPFLLDKPASFRAKLFNKLTGNELLDKSFKKCNKDSLKINREIKENEERLEKQKNEIIEYSKQYKQYKEKLERIQKMYVKLQDDVLIYNELKNLSDRLEKNKTLQEEVKNKSKEIKIVSEEKIESLKKKLEKLSCLNNLLVKLNKVEYRLVELESIKVKKTGVDFDVLKEKCDKLNELISKNNKLKKICDNQKKTIQEMKQLNEIIASKEKKLKNIWDDIDVCPLCKKKVH